MKRYALSLFMLLAGIAACAQFKINFHNSWGYNLVNIEEATGSPKFDDSLPSGSRQLTDWNQFYYNGEVQFLKTTSNDLDIGVALGYNRLYFYEERYRNFGNSDFYFDYGTIWTFEVSCMLNKYWDEWFGTLSAGLHSFQDGSGSTAGLAFGAGRSVVLSSSFSLPVVFKMDMVFGDGTTIAPNLGIGLQWALE
ncbi:hypothetical protein [Ekhidna sp.]|uniref:hypothetical protein n=1 Tax=Ekhidna sp. TaxID=2608089 RepID=UPI003CCBBD5F